MSESVVRELHNWKGDQGTWRIKSLFRELCSGQYDRDRAPYTLKNVDDPDGYKSLYRLYIESIKTDPTEYTFATTCLGGWKHWQVCQKSPALKDIVAEWRAEKEAYLQSVLLQKMFREVDGPKGLEATQFLIRLLGSSEKATKGRPSKQAIEAAAHNIAQGNQRLTNDFERLGLLTAN